jgi:hypothetical protein
MVPHWIMRHEKITGNALRLYLQLRSYAGSKEIAWPSKKTLATDLLLSTPTIEASLSILQSIGCIEISARFHPDGRQTSNLYRVLWHEPNEISLDGYLENLGGDPLNNLDGDPLKMLDGDPLKKLGTNLYLNEPRQIEPKPIEPIHAKPREKSKLDLSFDEFWSAYPRRSGKIKAKDAFRKASKECDPSEIIAGAQAFADDPNRQEEFTPHPATWLNQGRWEDDPLPERGTGQPSKTEANDKYLAKLDRQIEQYEKERLDAASRGESIIDFGEWTRRQDSGESRSHQGMGSNAY